MALHHWAEQPWTGTDRRRHSENYRPPTLVVARSIKPSLHCVLLHQLTLNFVAIFIAFCLSIPPTNYANSRRFRIHMKHHPQWVPESIRPAWFMHFRRWKITMEFSPILTHFTWIIGLGGAYIRPTWCDVSLIRFNVSFKVGKDKSKEAKRSWVCKMQTWLVAEKEMQFRSLTHMMLKLGDEWWLFLKERFGFVRRGSKVASCVMGHAMFGGQGDISWVRPDRAVLMFFNR